MDTTSAVSPSIWAAPIWSSALSVHRLGGADSGAYIA